LIVNSFLQQPFIAPFAKTLQAILPARRGRAYLSDGRRLQVQSFTYDRDGENFRANPVKRFVLFKRRPQRRVRLNFHLGARRFRLAKTSEGVRPLGVCLRALRLFRWCPRVFFFIADINLRFFV
jgi:hypothetical protein